MLVGYCPTFILRGYMQVASATGSGFSPGQVVVIDCLTRASAMLSLKNELIFRLLNRTLQGRLEATVSCY